MQAGQIVKFSRRSNMVPTVILDGDTSRTALAVAIRKDPHGDSWFFAIYDHSLRRQLDTGFIPFWHQNASAGGWMMMPQDYEEV